MDASDLAAIKSSWGVLKGKGTEMFGVLIKDNPNLKRYFSMKGSAVDPSHVTKVMDGIDKIVNGNYEAAKGDFQFSHKQKDIKKEELHMMIGAMKTVLKDNGQGDKADAWRKFIEYLTASY